MESLCISSEREDVRAHARTGRGESERGRERIPSRLHAVSTGPAAGLDLTNREIVTRAEIKSPTFIREF